MVTLVLGRRNGSDQINLSTDSVNADPPTCVQFNVPSLETPLKPGAPKWANYLKGVIAQFKGEHGAGMGGAGGAGRAGAGGD